MSIEKDPPAFSNSETTQDQNLPFGIGSSSQDGNRRSRFRLRLPGSSMLLATIEGMNYEVIEIAEHSMVVNSENVVNKNGICTGIIYWSDGTLSTFLGETGRLCEQRRVIWNVRGISTLHVLKEQRRLMKLFPETKDDDLRIEIFDSDG